LYIICYTNYSTAETNPGNFEFIDLLQARGISYLNYSKEELAEEIEAVSSLKLTPKNNQRSFTLIPTPWSNAMCARQGRMM
jgi:hypothetical protein